MAQTRDDLEQSAYERVSAELQAALGEHEYRASHREGATFDLDAAIASLDGE